MLVVNKFVPDEYYKKDNTYARPSCKVKRKSYNKNTQEQLKVLKENADSFWDIVVAKGTVLYNNLPVISTSDMSKWTYQIKTTGDMFGGNEEEIKEDLIKIMAVIDIVSEHKNDENLW